MIQRGFIPPNDPHMRNVPPPGYNNMNPGLVFRRRRFRKDAKMADITRRPDYAKASWSRASVSRSSWSLVYRSQRNHYGPWLLGGLIPMFVGIAQISVRCSAALASRKWEAAVATPPSSYRIPHNGHRLRRHRLRNRLGPMRGARAQRPR